MSHQDSMRERYLLAASLPHMRDPEIWALYHAGQLVLLTTLREQRRALGWAEVSLPPPGESIEVPFSAIIRGLDPETGLVWLEPHNPNHFNQPKENTKNAYFHYN